MKNERVPALNPKHPHTVPQNTDELLSKWEAVVSKAPAATTATSCNNCNTSLTKYLPKPPSHKQRRAKGMSGFDPFAEYSPVAPNDYQQCKKWMKDRKTSTNCVILTNMADEIDPELETETREECVAFGKVVRCKAIIYHEQASVFVEFAKVESAMLARQALDSRLFGGRRIPVVFVASMPEDP